MHKAEAGWTRYAAELTPHAITSRESSFRQPRSS
jgi:hypothetical protein